MNVLVYKYPQGTLHPFANKQPTGTLTKQATTNHQNLRQILLIQGCTNPWHQVTVATKFRTVAHNIFLDPQYGTCIMLPFWRLEF